MAICRYCTATLDGDATECADAKSCRQTMMDVSLYEDECHAESSAELKEMFGTWDPGIVMMRVRELHERDAALRALAQTTADARAAWEAHKAEALATPRCGCTFSARSMPSVAANAAYAYMCAEGARLFEATKDAHHALVEAILKGGAAECPEK